MSVPASPASPPDAPTPDAPTPGVPAPATALVVSGSGHWSDPWHPFADTSRRLGEVLTARGLQVTTREDVADALVALSGQVEGPGLLVLNLGNTDGPSPDLPADELGDPPTLPVLEAVAAGVHAHLARGGALLGMHSTTTALGTQDLFSRLLGGHWVRGRTMHPPLGACTVAVRTDAHPVTRGLEDVEVTDERYSWLHTEDDVTVLAEHQHGGERHPLVWVREQRTEGTGPPARVLYDGLGHDGRSYDSPGHRRLLEQGLDWLLRRDG